MKTYVIKLKGIAVTYLEAASISSNAGLVRLSDQQAHIIALFPVESLDGIWVQSAEKKMK
jgi:hypothetical protein